jgi:hypothetical protein
VEIMSKVWRGGRVPTADDLNRWESLTKGLSRYRSNKDINGIFQTIEYKRPDGTLFVVSETQGPWPYTSRIETYYDEDGVTVIKTVTATIGYDSDGRFISEVLE